MTTVCLTWPETWRVTAEPERTTIEVLAPPASPWPGVRAAGTLRLQEAEPPADPLAGSGLDADLVRTETDVVSIDGHEISMTTATFDLRRGDAPGLRQVLVRSVVPLGSSWLVLVLNSPYPLMVGPLQVGSAGVLAGARVAQEARTS